jgi:ribonuclease D
VVARFVGAIPCGCPFCRGVRVKYLTEAKDIQIAIARYAQAKILWLDTEVADYTSKQPRLSLIQILDDETDLQGESVVILDVLDKLELIDEFISKIMTNTEIEKVFHNASYDLNLLGKRKTKNITCTLEISRKIPYYLAPFSDRKLKTLAERLCNFTNIDKSEQTNDWGKRPLTEKQLNYAKMDVVYLAKVHQKLLDLSAISEPNPEADDICALTLRYRQLEQHWKRLDSEINNLRDRIKAAMNAQKIPEMSGFNLASQQRTTKKVALSELTKAIEHLQLQIDCPITLTKELQKQLGDLLEELPIAEEVQTILSLKVKELDEEDLPF